MAGTHEHISCRLAPAPASGRASSPRLSPELFTSTGWSGEEDSTAATRPIRWRSTPRTRLERARSSGISATSGATKSGCGNAGAGTLRQRRGRSTSSTSAPGGGSPKTTTAGSATASWPRSWLPIMEHPFYGSWGYQTTGYFAPTSRYGTPQDLMFLIDYLHQRGIGVLLDWVPSHFPSDPHGLGYFDGTHLYEHQDPRRGFHPDWNSYIFNYGRHEVRSFLVSSAMSWLDRYHVDGLRVDAVASMLYLDYSRRDGEWIPNQFGGRENLDAIEFLRRLNVEVYAAHPDVQMIAEESTSWPMVSRPTYVGGLGFGMKWDMGWMHDTLDYFQRDPVHRRYHHENLTCRSLYTFTENFVLPLSHDEVVHGKRSLLSRMPGDDWQRFANLRLLYGWMFGQPGKKLLFMGGEFGQWREWDHEQSLNWHLARERRHAGVERWLGDVNRLYSGEPALHQHDFDPSGFSWVDANDSDQ